MDQRPVARPIPQWVVVLGIPVMVLTAIAAVWLLLGFGVGGAQLDAIRTGGTIGVGLGGAVVLWLAVRRQRSTELDLLQKYDALLLAERNAAHSEAVAADNRAHQLQVAEAAERDATARRITDLYGKAVDQLGSEKAPVRLGGLYALERLAQDDAPLRQTIVNVLCAYLRMPYTPPASAGAGVDHEQRLQEREVRVTAQRILRAHLRPGVETFWSGIDLDLTGATLIEFDLAGCDVRTVAFARARFIGFTNFASTVFGDAQFGEAVFTEAAAFEGARFTAATTFRWATFRGAVWFTDARFRGETWFNGARFAAVAGFEKARLASVSFCEATFAAAEFSRAKFTNVSFDEAVFTGRADFSWALFTETADFDDAQFDTVDVANAVFQNGWPPELESYR